MQSALWKIAALVSVIGIGGFVVVQVHDQLQQQTAQITDPQQFNSLDNADGTGAGSTLDAIAAQSLSRSSWLRR